ncbi:SDR family NAD(P)-dependent oxidoreductase [Nocardioides sp.]|uniref:SDR family NAD(P)-dependent oxidoreductase n=1 Tax=Nocardioides sp. TaxID=35761 RepID=UPI0039E2F57A
MTTVAVLGATSGIAHAALREWAGRGVSLRLVARDAAKLERAAADLAVRGAAAVVTHVADLGTGDLVEEAVDWVFAEGAVDVVLVAFGVMPSQQQADADPASAMALLDVNGTLNLLAAQLAALRLERQGHGSLVVIGSVAGDRGRASNYLYGAAKAMVATGVAGLQHRLAGTEVHVTLVKPGPTATPMTDHLRGGKLRLAKAETVGHDIVRAVDRSQPVVYTPRKWQLIMAIIRRLPRRVFERTDL